MWNHESQTQQQESRALVARGWGVGGGGKQEGDGQRVQTFIYVGYISPGDLVCDLVMPLANHAVANSNIC